MSKGQLLKLYKSKPNFINYKPMAVQPLPKDYSNHLLFGGSISGLGVAFFGWKIKERQAEIDELRIISDKEARIIESEDSKIVRLAEIAQARETALLIQARQHQHEESMAQKLLDAKKGIMPQVQEAHVEVKQQVIRQGIGRMMDHFFNSNGRPPPVAQSTFDYPNLEIRVGWFLVITIFTYKEFVWMYLIFIFKSKR